MSASNKWTRLAWFVVQKSMITVSNANNAERHTTKTAGVILGDVVDMGAGGRFLLTRKANEFERSQLFDLILRRFGLIKRALVVPSSVGE